MPASTNRIAIVPTGTTKTKPDPDSAVAVRIAATMIPIAIPRIPPTSAVMIDS